MQPTESKKEIRALTGLRGVAAFYVMLYHFHIYEYLPDIGHDFFKHGYLCVDLFFVLSGFVMAKTYEKLFAHGFTGKNYKTFLGRRFARVFPLYLLLTLVAVLYYGTHPQNIPTNVNFSGMAITVNLLGIQNWGFAKSIIGPGWSISTEFAAYLLFPFYCLRLLSNSARQAIVVTVSAALALCALVLLPEDISHVQRFSGPLDMSLGTNFSAMARCLLEFPLGIALYRALNVPKIDAAFQTKGLSVLLSVAIFGLLMIPNTDLIIAFLFPLLIATLVHDAGWVAAVLKRGPLYDLGVVSYSFYLVHIMSFWAKWRMESLWTKTGLPHMVTAVIVMQTIFSLVMAIGLYFFVEKPSRRVLRHLFEPRKRIPEAGSPNLAAP